MTTILHRVLAPVDRSATSIESAFLQAGDSLGRGLEAFERLSSGLASFSDDLASGGMARASAALDGLSQELVLISGTLPEDAATLQDLVAANDQIARRLENLLENMRMMMIIARSARIEAVVFDEGQGLDGFTQEVSKLTGEAQVEISSCATHHAKLTQLIKGASNEQSNLDRDFRERLIELARELSETFSLIEERQRGGLALVQDVAERSHRITQSTGMAMVSLQSGDSTRQRLEHVISAVRGAIAIDDGSFEEIDIPESVKPTAIAALCRLQGSQLRDTVADFDANVTSIDEAIRGLIGDTHDLARSSQAVYGSQGRGAESFLTVFRARLSSAAGVLRTCEASRQSVERATASLRTLLNDLHQTISHLNMTCSHLVLLGVNAGLKATRLGSGGRSLVVIADEIKRLAGAISKDTQGLMQVFDQVRTTSHRLDREARLDDRPQAAELDREIVSIMGELDTGDQKIADFLKTLDRNARDFDAQLNRARRDFKSAVSMNEELLDAANTLESFAERCAADARDDGQACRIVDAFLSPKYTMARERDIHATLIGSSLDDDAGLPMEAREMLQADDFLFA